MKLFYSIALCLFLTNASIFAQPNQIAQLCEQLAHKHTDAKILFYARISINDGYADISKFRLLKNKNTESYICYKSDGSCEYFNISPDNRMVQSDIKYIVHEIEDGDYFLIITDKSKPSINNPLIARINGSFYYIPPSNDLLTLFDHKILLNEVKMVSIVNDINNNLNNGTINRNITMHFGRHINDTLSINDNIITAIRDYNTSQYGACGQLKILKLKQSKDYYRVDVLESINRSSLKKRFLLDKYDLWVNDWYK